MLLTDGAHQGRCNARFSSYILADETAGYAVTLTLWREVPALDTLHFLTARPSGDSCQGNPNRLLDFLGLRGEVCIVGRKTTTPTARGKVTAAM